MPEDLGPWSALSVPAAAALMRHLGAPWWIAGGWAIDLFLGRQTRDHGDIDVAILRRDQPALAKLLCGWDVQVAADGVLTPWRPGDWLEGGKRHQFWARPTPDAPWALEILLEESDDERWIYRRNDAVFLPLGQVGRRNLESVPYVSPEVALLYKAGASSREPRNEADFAAAAPALSRGARAWLASALTIAHPGHPWTERLQGMP